MKALWMLVLLAPLLMSCSPEPGSEAWCHRMKDTPKSDWSIHDAATYAQYCILGNYKE